MADGKRPACETCRRIQENFPLAECRNCIARMTPLPPRQPVQWKREAT